MVGGKRLIDLACVRRARISVPIPWQKTATTNFMILCLKAKESSDSNGFMAFERDGRFYTFIPFKTMEPNVGARGESGNSSWKQESTQNKDNNSNNARSLNKRN
ncbi:hypothetical protein SLE2022_134800 [Rubroshorea leprosula]